MENNMGRIVNIWYDGTLHGCSDTLLIDQEVARSLCDLGVGQWHKFCDGPNEKRIATIQLKIKSKLCGYAVDGGVACKKMRNIQTQINIARGIIMSGWN
jgi:hypothetical protein